MKNNLKETMEFCGKNYKKEITKIVAVNVVLLFAAVALYFFYKSIIYSSIVLAITLVIDFVLLSSYRSQKIKLSKARDEEFIQIISYFQIFISNHLTVYQCFNLLIPYSSNWMAEQLGILIDQIDNDKTVQPFVDFARKFNDSIVENVMLSIYQMVDQGESNEQLNQFAIFFSQLSKQHQKTMIDKKERSLSTVDMLPLVGTGGITVLLIISILFILGDVINVF